MVEPNIGFTLSAEVLSGPFQAHCVWCLELLVKDSGYLHRNTELGLQEFWGILKDMGLYSLASDICKHGKLFDMCFSLWLLWEWAFMFFPMSHLPNDHSFTRTIWIRIKEFNFIHQYSRFEISSRSCLRTNKHKGGKSKG